MPNEFIARHALSGDISAPHTSGIDATLMIGTVLAATVIFVSVARFLLRRRRPGSSLTGTPASAKEKGEPSINAAEALVRMRSAYASLEHYQDTGLVAERVDPKDPMLLTHGTFSTTYRRPRSLAFFFQHFVEHEEREWYWVVMDDDRIESRGPGRADRHTSASAAFASLTDVSPGAPLVLPLLGAGADLERCDDLQNPEYVGVGHVEGHACHKIRGRSGIGTIVLWIDQQLSLIREIELDDGKFIIIVTPDVNSALPSGAFTTPPAGVSLPTHEGEGGCAMCGGTSARMHRRTWFNHWSTVVISGRKHVEIEELCHECHTKERRTFLLYLGIVVLAVIAASLIIMREFDGDR
jgi:hypothetical protein